MSVSTQIFRKCSNLLLRQRAIVSKNVLAFGVTSAHRIQIRAYTHPQTHDDVRNMTKKEWEQRLTPEQFSVCREQCTEPPFSGIYNNHYEAGTYNCVCCGAELFGSEAKYDSGTGWPSFYDAYKVDEDVNIIERPENSADLSTYSTEVICKKCDSHLGHVFEDGPEPTGKRYCINSIALKFAPKKE